MYDIDWAKDSEHLLSGAVDSSVFLWNIKKRKSGKSYEQCFRDHRHFVQGVAFDPFMNYFVTESSDRSCKVYKAKKLGKTRNSKKKQPQSEKVSPEKESIKRTYKLHADLSKRLFSTSKPENKENGGKTDAVEKPKKPLRHSHIMDDSLPSFFRRLTFSPDGRLLLVPAGVYKEGPKEPVSPTVYVYVRGVWNAPSAHLPGLRNPAIGVRFNPGKYIISICT